MAAKHGLTNSRPYKVSKQKTTPCSQNSSMGWTFGRTIEEQRLNFRAQSTFSVKPKWHVEGQVGCFICDVFYRHSADPSRPRTASLQMSSIYDLKSCLDQLKAQHPSEIIMAPTLKSKDFAKIIDAELTPLLNTYNANNCKKPVDCIGLQAQILPKDFLDLRREHLEFFFNETLGVLGSDGNPHPNPKTAFHEPHLRDVPQVEFEFSGLPGFIELINKLSGRGVAFFEEVTNTINLGFYSFFAPFNRLIFGKQGIVILEGPTNMGKTKDALLCLFWCSDMSQFLSGTGTTLAGVKSSGKNWGLLQVLDDNSSLRLEELYAVGEYEGASTRTKTGGDVKSLGTLAITCNPGEGERSARVLSGRCVISRKEHCAYEAPKHALLAISDRKNLTSAIYSKNKPMDVLMNSTDLLFKQVPIPKHLTGAVEELTDAVEELDLSAISPDGVECCQYIIWVAEVAEAIKSVSGKPWRVVLNMACFFVWPYYLDVLLKGTDTEWTRSGGSEAYYSQYLKPYIANNPDLFGSPEGEAVPFSLEQEFFFDFLGPVLEELNKRFPRDDAQTDGPGVQIEHLRLTKKDQVLYLWFRSTLPDGNYKQMFGTESDIKRFKSVFEKLGREKAFTETCKTKTTKSSRGWCFPLTALPHALALKVCQQLWRSDVKQLVERTIGECMKGRTGATDEEQPHGTMAKRGAPVQQPVVREDLAEIPGDNQTVEQDAAKAGSSGGEQENGEKEKRELDPAVAETGGNSVGLVGAKGRPRANLNNALLVTPHVSAGTTSGEVFREKRRKKPKNKSKSKKSKNQSFQSSSASNTENSETTGDSSVSGSSKSNSPSGKSGSSSPSGASSTGAAIVL